MTFSPRDAKDVSSLVAKKLELYLNYERREQRFDPQGYYRTTPKMQTLDLMYQMLDKAELNGKQRQSPTGRQVQRKKSKSPSRKDKKEKRKHKKSDPKPEQHSNDSSDIRNGEHENVKEASKDGDIKSKKTAIKPKLVDNSRRVVPRKEADRITKTVNKVFEEQDLDKLHVIHRYRPLSRDVAPITENGKVANYTLHIGSALHSKNYVDYYMKEGLQSGNKGYSSRLQKLKSKQEKEDNNEGMSTRSSKDVENNDPPQQEWAKRSRMREILSPLNSSADSVVSSSLSHETTRNLTPIIKDKPVYNTFLSSTPQSSRASTGKMSSHLNDARMFSQGFGYRVVQDNNDEILGAGSVISRQESRADIASSEEYCKFSTSKNASVSEIERDGDEKSDGPEGIIIETDPIKLRDVEMKYKKYQSSEFSSLLKQSDEDSRAHANYLDGQWLESEATARSDRSGKSQKSGRSHRSVSSAHSHKCENSYRSSQYSAQFEPFDSTLSEDGSSTQRSCSVDTSLQSKCRGRNIHLEPIKTVIDSPEIPRLGLTSDLNDTIHTCTSSKMEDYMTAEEKARIHPDTRAADEKVNSNETRAEEKDVESNDKRAEVSLNRYSGYEEYINTDEILRSEPPVSCVHCAEGETNNEDQNQKDQQNSGEENQDSGNDGGQEGDSGEGNEGTTNMASSVEDTHQATSSRREETLKADSARACKMSSENMNTRKNSVKGKSEEAQTPLKPKRANEMEGSDTERGEDEVRNKEFDRGAIPVVEVAKVKKAVIERGDDTPRIVEQKSRLTVSAKRRGRSDYHPVEDNERGLETEYFQPIDNEKEEYFTSDISARESELGSNPSTRPSSACSQSSQVTDKSEGSQKKKRSLKRLSKASSMASVPPEIKEESRPQSSASKDGRGDDSQSIKSGMSGQRQKGESVSDGKSPNDGEADNEGGVVTERPSSGQSFHNHAAEMAQYKRPPSISSRGSITAKEKLGAGHGYCISGEMLTRGVDDNSPRALKELQLAKKSNKNEGNSLDAVVRKESLQDAGEAGTHCKASQQSMHSNESEERAQTESKTNVAQGSKPASSASNKSNGSLNNVVSEGTAEQERLLSANKWKGEEREGHDKSFNSFKSEGSREHRHQSVNSQRSDDQNKSFSTGYEKNQEVTEEQIPITETVVKQAENVNIPAKRQSSRSNIAPIKSIGEVNQHVAVQEIGVSRNIHPAQISGVKVTNKPDEDIEHVNVQYEMDIMSPPGDRKTEQSPIKGDENSRQQNSQMTLGVTKNEKEQIEEVENVEARTSPYFSCSEANQEIAQSEKAFIESESSEIIKEAMLGSTSLEDSETVIDFRPLSASTAKSIGNDVDAANKFTSLSSQYKSSDMRQPSRISEVTECEGSPTPGRNTSRSPNVYPDVKENKNVTHPAHKGVVKRTNSGQVLNLADLRSEPIGNCSQLEDDVFDHPAKCGSGSTQESATSQNGKDIVEIANTQPAIDRSENEADRTESSHKMEASKEQMKEERSFAVTNQPSEENRRGQNPEMFSLKRTDRNEKVPAKLYSVSSQKSAEKENVVEKPLSVSSQKSEIKEKDTERSFDSLDKEKVTERPPSVDSRRHETKENETERPSAVNSHSSLEKEKTAERPPSVTSQKSTQKQKVAEGPLTLTSINPTEKENAAERSLSDRSLKSAKKVKDHETNEKAIQKSEGIEEVEQRPSSVLKQSSEVQEQMIEIPPSVSSPKFEVAKNVAGSSPKLIAKDNENPVRHPSICSQSSNGSHAYKEKNNPNHISSGITSAEKGDKHGLDERTSAGVILEQVTKHVVEAADPTLSKKSDTNIQEQFSDVNAISKELKGSDNTADVKQGRPLSDFDLEAENKAEADIDQCQEAETIEKSHSKNEIDNSRREDHPLSAGNQKSGCKEVSEKIKSETQNIIESQKHLEGDAISNTDPAVETVLLPQHKEKMSDSSTSLGLERKDKIEDKPCSVSSQRSEVREAHQEATNMALCPKPTEDKNLQKHERSLSAISQKLETEVKPKEESFASSQKSQSNRIQEENKQGEMIDSNQKGKSNGQERPVSAASQKSEEKVTKNERPSSIASHKSEDKVAQNERLSSAGSLKSEVKVTDSHKAEGKVTVNERPSSIASHRSEEKEAENERPRSTTSNKSEVHLKVTDDKKPNSIASHKSEEELTKNERPSSIASHKSDEKKTENERRSSTASHKENVAENERPNSIASHKSEENVAENERPNSTASHKSEEKEAENERPRSAAIHKENVAENERPSSIASHKSDEKETENERPNSTASHNENVAENERPSSIASHKSDEKETENGRPRSAASHKENVAENERQSSIASHKSDEKETENERPSSTASHKENVAENERSNSIASRKSDEKETENERPSSTASHKENIAENERPNSIASHKSEENVAENERPNSIASHKSEEKEAENERPRSAASNKSEVHLKVTDDERPNSIASHKSEGELTENERPSSIANCKLEENVDENESPSSIASHKSDEKETENERPNSIVSHKSDEKETENERPNSIASHKSEEKVTENERPNSITSHKSDEKVTEKFINQKEG